jgi:ABC-type transport system substrate-binding protein
MKLVKNFVFAVLLASFLAVNAFAGDQGTPAAPAPSPERITVRDETLPDVIDPNTGCLSTETSDSLFYEALAALLSVY